MVKSHLENDFYQKNYDLKESDYIEFDNNIHQRIKICPMYFKLGFSPFKSIFGRYAVLTRLLKIINLLPNNCGIMIWDVYRPRLVQGKLFNWMREQIKNRPPS